ncbi:MAG: hypothetical protein AXA67_01530 [Methylothermaceae bacteria B42]|nr:MAG: hypothetical protein AXA67_01530 [Methylothermaceae bacteria B42]HHJ39043.1 hypothetical protein [Methylothermaceae bacterium]
MKKPANLLVITCLGIAMTLPALVNAATYTVYGNRASFLADLGGPTDTQDFESFPNGTDMMGVEFLPGISVTTNLDRLEIFQGTGDKELFSIDNQGRGDNGAFSAYDIHFSLPHKAVGFDIEAFDPDANPGLLSIEFKDGDSLGPFPVPPGATEQTPVFIGVLSDTPITKITWNEPFDPISKSCCEETSLDNFVIPQAVPLPPALVMALPAYGLIAGMSWRKKPRN